MNSKRIFYLDNIRFCASFLVILGHSHPEYVADAATHSLTTAGLWASLFGLMASPSSELFMTISGAILLPVRIPDKEFFRKRFSKVLFPLLIWSLVYLCAGLGPQNRTAVEALLKLPFTPVLDVFWFMYVICGLYLFAPIISKWILYEDRNSMRFYLGIWAFVSFLPLLNLISPGLYDSQGSYYFVLNNWRLFGLYDSGNLPETLSDVRQQKQISEMLCVRRLIQCSALPAQGLLSCSSAWLHLRQPLLYFHRIRLHHIHHNPVRFQIHHPHSGRIYGIVQALFRHLSFAHPHHSLCNSAIRIIPAASSICSHSADGRHDLPLLLYHHQTAHLFA